MLMVTAANVGDRPVTLSSCVLALPDGRTLVYPQAQRDQLPFELQPGKSCTQYMLMGVLAEGLARTGLRGQVKVIPRYASQSGSEFSGKPYTFKPGDWA